MIILPGDVAAQRSTTRCSAPDPHRPAGDAADRGRARQGGRAGLRRQEDRHPRRRGHPRRARRGAPALARPCRPRSRTPTAARTCWRPTTRPRVGMTGLLGWGGATEALADCDLLFMLGTDFPYHAFLPSGKTIIQVDDKPLHLGRRAAVDLGLAGDVGETLRALIPQLEQRTDTHFLDHVVKDHHQMVKGIQTYVNHEGSGQGLRPEMVADRPQRPGRGRRGLHRRHRHVQRVGRALPGDEARPPDPGLVQPRLDGQRDAAGHRREGRLARPPGGRAVRRRRLLDADGRAAHRGRASTSRSS